MSFFNLFKKSPKSLQPVSKKPRPKCPFYGFYFGGIPNVFADSEGNQCAAVITAHSLCQMEFRGQTPDWNKCPVNNEKCAQNIESIKDSAMVFPKELRPEGKKEWEGITLRQWMEYVMGDQVPRPQ